MEFRRLFDIPLHQKINTPRKDALIEGFGATRNSLSSDDILEKSMWVSAGAVNIGMERGDRAWLMSKRSGIRWLLTDMGLTQLGIIPISVHSEWNDDILKKILSESTPKMVLVEDREQFARFSRINKEAGIKEQIRIYVISDLPDIPDWNDFITAPIPEHYIAYETAKAAIHEDDLAAIVYSAGTTGMPKGIALSHKNMVSRVYALAPLLPLKPSSHVISILSMSGITEKVMLYTYLAIGCRIQFIPYSENILEDLGNARPHFLTCTPLKLKELYMALLKGKARRGDTARKRYLWAIRQGTRYGNYGRNSIMNHFKFIVADLLLFRKWRKVFGGRIEGILLYGNTLPGNMARLFSAAGIDVRNSFGMAETAGIVSMNRFGNKSVNFNTAGLLLEGWEMKITESSWKDSVGEILLRGDGLSKGYWKDEELTYERFQYGWLKSGDMGYLGRETKHLTIVGRKENAIVLENGSRIHPTYIENKIKDSLFIEDCIIVGRGKSFPVALLVPSLIHLELWCAEKKISFDKFEELLLNQEVKNLFDQQMVGVNTRLQDNEKIRKYQIVDNESWNNPGFMTTFGKPDRAAIKKEFMHLFREMYEG